MTRLLKSRWASRLRPGDARVRAGRVRAAFALLLALSACVESGPAGPKALGTTLFLRADLSGTPIATLVVRVTAPDITTPLAFNLGTVNGVAAGTVTIPAGSNRTLALDAYDAGGIEIDSGSVTLTLQPGMNPTLSILLTPLAGEPPITVVLGSFSVTVQPAGDTLAPGDTESVTATMLDASGNPLTGQVTWATLDPKVAAVVSTGPQRGRVTARGPGRATVLAIYGGIAAPGAIAVTNPLWPHEPAGWQVVTDYDMHALDDGGWMNSYPGNITDGGITVVNDPTAPLSPPAVWQFFFPIGFQGGVSPGVESIVFDDGASAIYAGFWWKPSNPWQGHSSEANKLLLIADDDQRPDDGAAGTYWIRMQGAAPPYHTYAQFEYDQPTVNYYENQDTTAVTLGQWHQIEFLLDRNTAILRWWMDGKLKGSYTDVYYAGSVFTQARLTPIWGGIGEIKIENDYFWFDHVHMSHP